MASGTKRKPTSSDRDLGEEPDQEPDQKRIKSASKRMSARRLNNKSGLGVERLPVRKIVDDIIEEEEAEAEAETALEEVSESETEDPADTMEKNGGEITMGAMRQLLNDQLKKVATREDIDSIGERISANAEEIAQLRGIVKQIEKDVERSNTTNRAQIMRDVTRIVDDRISEQCSALNQTGSTNGNGYSHKEESYLRARRSIRIWPIEGDDDSSMKRNLEQFLTGALQMDPREVEGLGIEEITRTRLRHNAKIHLEVLVRFSSYEARDSVSMRGGCLAEYVDNDRRPLAGLRMDVPNFLNGTFKLLTSYGYKLRRMHGEGTKRYVKFDEANLSLYLDAKLPDSDEWFQISPAQARELEEQRDQLQMRRLQQTLGLDSGTSSGVSVSSVESAGHRNPHSFPIRLISQSNSQTTNSQQSRWTPAPRRS